MLPPVLFATGFNASNTENELAHAVWERHLSEPYVALFSFFASTVGRNSWATSHNLQQGNLPDNCVPLDHRFSEGFLCNVGCIYLVNPLECYVQSEETGSIFRRLLGNHRWLELLEPGNSFQAP